jgi:hypothetical protein
MSRRRVEIALEAPALGALTTQNLPPWDGHGSLDITKASGTSWTSGGVMPVSGERRRKYGCALIAPAVWLALSLSGGLAMGASSAATRHAEEDPTALISANNSVSASSSTKVAQAAQPDLNCPGVEVRRGAATLTVGPTGERTAMTLKYQASFVRLARECSTVEGNMVMKVGVEGRIVLGPAGSPGQVSVPLRFAVVEETPSGMRAITTKFINVPAEVGPSGNSAFVYVEEALSFPIPTPATALDEYLVYVGFDPVSAEAQSKPQPKARAKDKSKPKAKPAAGD